MAAALTQPLPTPPALDHSKHLAKVHNCPKCGTQVSLEQGVEDAQRRIRDLEAQIEMLKEKATAAVDKCADYEDQLRNMRSAQQGLLRSNTSDSLTADRASSNDDIRPSTANSTTAKQSRFSFLIGRRGSPAQSQLQPPTTPPPPMADTELLEQLEKERSLRAKAEERAKKVDSEIEELSVQLFSQANEMVATERKARAKLEARVEQLEKKDKDKMARLERLEKAVSRIDRVKALLAAPTPGPTALQQKS
ncbi:hypothetical protein BU24DRAFT_466032 [Aaosphaeria arxii CBS 175.79]|uniref:GDP/GTP exchange factor Sec2 N-terminal domain-containing protein n=1 Tax=Aaosphaeria arxii CBS 175.79 TaxID=1450172 RepID=A0A6A5XES4_9PLEO|nr:uncharacterized protein BU24DRAFT_466032 [Aaosphaeria arxii CBS 175.79]KAF2011307.1 hypothetical protein BU24DRAFT_466032 [Aaosphaeria arxii CBS 175.79]